MATEDTTASGTRAATAARGSTAAALAVGTVGLLMLGVQPILLGELVAQRRISLEGVGMVAMGEIVALGLGVLVANAALPVTRMRSVMALAALGAMLCDLLSVRLDGDLPFATVRALAGLCEGVLLWVGTCAVVRAPKPDRLAGIFLVAQTLAQAALAALLAACVVPWRGWAGGFELLAVLSAALLLLLPALEARFAPLAGAAGTPSAAAAPRGAAVLLAAWGQMAAIGALWAYLDPLGRGKGLDAQSVQLLVSLVLVTQVLGGSVAALVVQRMPANTTLLALVAAQAGLSIAMAGAAGSTAPGFTLQCAGFGFLWLFSMPFHIRLAFHAEPSGRLAALVPGVQLLGVACGPLLASLFVEGDQAGAVPLVCAGLTLLAACALWVERVRAEAGALDHEGGCA